MLCPHCGRKNYIYALDCRHCAKTMKTLEQLDAELKRLWEGLPSKVQDKVKKDYQNDLKKYLKDMESIRRSAFKEMAMSAIILGILGISSGFIILPDILLGALAGFIIRKQGGGAFWGVALFAAVYVVSFALKWSLGWAIHPSSFPPIIFFWAGSVWLALTIGRHYGERIGQQSTE